MVYSLKNIKTGEVINTPYSIDVQEFLSTGVWDFAESVDGGDKLKAAAQIRAAQMGKKIVPFVAKETNDSIEEKEEVKEEQLGIKTIGRRKLKIKS